MVEDARDEVASLLDVRSEEVIFTSGGTEANFLALWGSVLGCENAGTPIERLLVSAIEHDSVLNTAKEIAERRTGLQFDMIPLTGAGIVDLDALDALLAKGGPTLVAVMAANNETGIVQPYADVAQRVHAAGGLCTVDAVQACGKLAADFAGADYLTISAHKLGGPQGAGALVVRERAPFAPVIRGGGQESNREETAEQTV